MARKVRFRPAARSDLLSLYTYLVEEAGAHQAGAYVQRVENACASLAEFPERGRPRDDILPGLRTLTVARRITIAFLVEGDVVRIVGVFQAGRDVPAVLRLRRPG